MTDVELTPEVVEEELVEEQTEMTIAEAMVSTITGITGCTLEAGEQLANIFNAMVTDTIHKLMNDREFIQGVFNNMLIHQINSNNRLASIEATINKADWVVIDEEHPTSDIRVNYNGEEGFEWVFERRSDDGWTPLEMTEEGRARMVALAGKFFDGRIDRTGYIVDANRLGK